MKISISGIRGVFGSDDLSLYEVIKYSRLFAQSLIKASGKCILERDTRPFQANSNYVNDVVNIVKP